MTGKTYQLYVNEERTVKVEVWLAPEASREGQLTAWVATREHPNDMWGPPVRCDEEEHDQMPKEAS